MFQLVDALKKKDFIVDLELCSVLFEDNCYYPWIMLVPMRENVKNMTHLSMEDRLQLMKEIAMGENVINRLFSPDQINTAAIGNLTPQLHVHIIARKIGDPDWPGTVWNSHKLHYKFEEKVVLIEKVRNALQQESSRLL
jgi:diadenosine tetraphosphate (Ap4A) HIT family hydrolase